jgi:hypothetical protein
MIDGGAPAFGAFAPRSLAGALSMATKYSENDLVGDEALQEMKLRASAVVPTTDMHGDPAGFAEVAARKAAAHPATAPVAPARDAGRSR